MNLPPNIKIKKVATNFMVHLQSFGFILKMMRSSCQWWQMELPPQRSRWTSPMKKFRKQWDNLYMIKLTHSSKLGDVCISNEGCRSDLGRCWYLTNVASSNHSKILAHSFVLSLCDLIKVLMACKQVRLWVDNWLNLRVDVIQI
jgi:hypothetical protein